jgi:hypothetical protein
MIENTWLRIQASPLFRGGLLTLFWVLLDAILKWKFNQHNSTQFNWGYYTLSLASSLGLGIALLHSTLWLGRLSPLFGWSWAILLSLLYTSLLFINSYLFIYFGEYLFPSALQFIQSDSKYLWDFLLTYGTLSSTVAFLVLSLIGTFFFGFWKAIPSPIRLGENRKPSKYFEAATFSLALAVAIFGLKTMEKKAMFHLTADVTSVESISKFVLKLRDKTPSLRPVNRPLARVAKSPFPMPRTIIIVVNESMGTRSLAPWKHAGSPDINGAPRWHRRLDDSMQWVTFPNAVTNAGASEISLTSIYTGVGPEESYAKLHTMPMLWDLAKQRGYQTAYVTSQRLRWACLWDFLMKEPIDFLSSIDVNGLPVIHDTGAEDLLTVEIAEKWLRELPPTMPALLFFNTNALHVPFQSHSNQMDLSKIPGDAYEKALTLVDSSMESLFCTLESLGRYDDALILVTGDHGETPKPLHPQARVTSFFQEIIQIPLAMKFYRNIPDTTRNRIQMEKNKLTANLDIVPTVVDLLGLLPPKDMGWQGHSLFEKPDSTRIVTTINTNEIRRWDHEGFGMSTCRYRWICEPRKGALAYDLESDPEEKRPIELPSEILGRLRKSASMNPILKPILLEAEKWPN